MSVSKKLFASSKGNAYIYPFVLWLSLIFLSFILSSISIYENKQEIYQSLMDQLDVQVIVSIAREEIAKQESKSGGYDENYLIRIDNIFTQIDKQEEINDYVLFSATIEFDDKKYHRNFFVKSKNE